MRGTDETSGSLFSYVDREGLADRATALREGREAEGRHTAQEAAQEQEGVKELEIEREIER